MGRARCGGNVEEELGFIYRDGYWQLAPAYDLLSVMG